MDAFGASIDAEFLSGRSDIQHMERTLLDTV